MRFLVGFTMFAFLVVGAGLVFAAVRDLALKLRRSISFRRTTGTVVRLTASAESLFPAGFETGKRIIGSSRSYLSAIYPATK